MTADENAVREIRNQCADLREHLTTTASNCTDPGAALMLRTVREHIARLEADHLTAYLNRPAAHITRSAP